MAKDSTHKYDRIFKFLENNLIRLLLLFLIILLLGNHYLYENINEWSVKGIDLFIQNQLNSTLNSLKNSLLSISAIFIGIYVTVFTLLGGIRVDSIFAYLNEKTFNKLIKFIRNAFIAAFGYIIVVLLTDVIFKNNEDIPYTLIVLNMVIVIYMLLTALRFGIILYVAFNKDLKNIQNSIQKHREDLKQIEELRFRLNRFLDIKEEEERNQINDELSEKLNKRQDNNKKE